MMNLATTTDVITFFAAFPIGAVLRGPFVGAPTWAAYVPFWDTGRVVRHAHVAATGEAALVLEVEIESLNGPGTTEMMEFEYSAGMITDEWVRLPESTELLVNLDRFLRSEGKQARSTLHGQVLILPFPIGAGYER